MDSTEIIYIMIGILLLCLIIMSGKMLKALMRIVIRGGLGLAFINIINALIDLDGLYVAPNIFNAVFIGGFGIWGLICLYILSFLL